jgi:hypothetical protein
MGAGAPPLVEKGRRLMAVTFSQAEVNAYRDFMLKNRGITEMRIGDRLYKFEPIEKMREQLAYMVRNLDTAAAPRTRYAQTNKGF